MEKIKYIEERLCLMGYQKSKEYLEVTNLVSEKTETIKKNRVGMLSREDICSAWHVGF